MIFLRTILLDIKRCVFSVRFIIAFFCYGIVIYLSMLPDIRHGIIDVILFDTVRQGSVFSILYLLCAAIPCTTMFCEDWENKYLRYNILRSGKSVYAVAKSVSCSCVAFIIIAGAETIFYIVMSLNMPFYDESFGMIGSYSMYYIPFQNGNYINYVLNMIIIKALSAGFFCSLALIISVKIPNIFVALSAPLLSFYFLRSLFDILRVPYSFNPSYMGVGRLEIAGNQVLTLVYGASYYLFLIAVLCLIFLFFIDRRVESD